MHSTDVLVVGGGPAGLATALALRKNGARVTVADSMTPPFDKTCGEGMMPDSLRELALLGVELSEADGADFHGIRFVGEAGPKDKVASRTQASHTQDEWPLNVATAAFPSGTGMGVRRQALHRRMREQAEQAGVALRWNCNVQLQPDGAVICGGEPMRYGLLVGADGQGSRVRRWASLDAGVVINKRFGFRQHFAVAPWSPYVEMHWGATSQAYVAPVSPDEVCVISMARNPQFRMAEVLEELPWLAAKLRGANSEMTPLDAERGGVMNTRRFHHVSRGRVALVGDSSGSVDAITGEGLAMGFRQALLLAECLESGDMEDVLARYDRLHPKILQVPHVMARAMLLMDRYPILRERAMRMLAGKPELLARMLGVHVGAEPLGRFLVSRGWEVALRLALPFSDSRAAHSIAEA
ncbi:MAG TPA: FAD-dependent monooxygenase [Acidobacteriaceae bacterium]|jgi:2-polyprenyl-6-methoxyphenol hydroxylase-like FAD-dependent oxidoreductase|nr:FAD-dependent monooxygenase [Acidobacteriaceae bacterium]